jgi:hypothetical protein
MKQKPVSIALAVLLVSGVLAYRVARPFRKPVAHRVSGTRTVDDVLRDLGPAAEARLAPHFVKAGVPFPPSRLALLGFKAEKRLEVWAGVVSSGPSPTESAPTRVGGPSGFDSPWRHIRDYPVLAASGGPGPKLREGDGQVPEGVYRIETLNPQSRYHLSLRLDYPNAFDREQGRRDGRTNLGTDIYIHGGAVSIGCLAMGDEAVEELFVLSARTGLPNIRAILAPSDLRAEPAAADRARAPGWVGDLYDALRAELQPFR